MMENIEALEKRLWAAADQLRANSGLGSNEYFLPLLGILFLRQASTRFNAVTKEVEDSLPSRGGQKRQSAKDDYTKRRSIFLRKESKYEHLASLQGEKNLGKALNHAMDMIEADYDGLKGVLPRNYEVHNDTLLRSLIGIFNDDVLQKASGDVFGRIYEYFLMKFSMAGAHDSGEFFTPPSIVQMIVNVIEPDHGKVFDPACGSGGMFVQTSHFLEQQHKDVTKAVTFYGQEKNETTINIAKMNLAVHGLEGDIKKGNTFYEDQHEMLGKADFVMANPPFNVDTVDANKIRKDPRLPFGLPGVNKSGTVSNGNYLWISYFYSYLNAKGRTGFVMSSQASSGGHGEKEVRRKIVETGQVDVMISIRPNFFYTRSVPCELWFFDKGKPKELHNKVLMIDARNIYRKVTRKIFDFSPEQLKNLSAIVWLYRGKTDRYFALVKDYLGALLNECGIIPEKLEPFEKGLDSLKSKIDAFAKVMEGKKELNGEGKKFFAETLKEWKEAESLYEKDRDALLKKLAEYGKEFADVVPDKNTSQHKARGIFDSVVEQIKGLIKQIDLLYKIAVRTGDIIEKDLNGHDANEWDSREANKQKKELESSRKDAVEQLKLVTYYHKQIHWLQVRFPDAKLANVEGLVKLVDRKEISKNDWNLTPGQDVGVAPNEEDNGFDFEEALHEIHVELADLNKEAVQLAKTIQQNFEELGI